MLTVMALSAPPVLAAPQDSAGAQNASQLVNAACTQCHGLGPISAKLDGVPGWTGTVRDMVMRGAQLNEQDMQIVVRYLATRYGPGNDVMRTTLPLGRSMAPPAGGKAPVFLPAGGAEPLVAGYCSACHDAGRIAASEMNRDEWKQTIRSMTTRMGVSIADGDADVMAAYLADNFGKRVANNRNCGDWAGIRKGPAESACNEHP